MASFAVSPTEIGAHEKTLTASAVDTVTFAAADAGDGIGRGGPPRTVEIFTDGAAPIDVTFDGSAPTVNGAHCHHIPAFAGSQTYQVADDDPTDPVVVKLISSGAPVYSVCRAG